MKIAFIVAAIMLLGVNSSADVFNLGDGLRNLETVVVNNPGNQKDTCGVGAGAVDYSYQIGKYEVTSAQYAEFLNAVARNDKYQLYESLMSSYCGIERSGNSGGYTYNVLTGWANKPVTYVSFVNACRFANWLNNGQPTGSQCATTTEDGAYNLNGYSAYTGQGIARNTGSKWFLPTDDEWYKAAYYDDVNNKYYRYATQSNEDPNNNIIDKNIDNSANYSNLSLADVGIFTNSKSPYGTYDQSGNAWEWTETIQEGSYRQLRGGSYQSDSYSISSLDYEILYPMSVGRDIGFRVAATEPVPEPSSILALLGGLAGLGGFALKHKMMS